MFSTFKQANGRYRWILFSSSSFVDRDGEIVSQAAQEQDCARMNATKQFGTLDWWHELYLILGDGDFAAMHGRIRVESGLYRDDDIGAAMAAHQDDLAASIAFFHPVNEPVDGVYQNIKTFSRAILPRGTESNLLTRLFVAEEDKTMVKEKIDALVNLLGGGQDAKDKVSAILGTAAATEAKAADAGLAFKAAGDAPADEKKPEAGDTQDAAPIEPEAAAQAAPEAKADMPVTDMPAEVEPAEPQDNGGDVVAALQAVIAPLVARIEELAASLGQMSANVTQMETANATAAKAADETKTALSNASKQIAALEARLKELEGDTPRGFAKPGFVASRSDANVTTAAKNAPQPMESAMETISKFILGGMPNN